MDVLDIARWQFGITTVYHFLMVPLTIGLGILVAVMHTMWVRTDKPEWLRMTRFWGTDLHEKNTRARPASIVSVKPSAAGRMSTSTSTAAPTDVHAHRYAPVTLPNIASGTVSPGLSFRQARRLIDISATQIHEPTTTSTTPR